MHYASRITHYAFRMKIISFLGRQPMPFVFVSFTLVVLIGAVDYLTGADISFALFYLIPIGLVSWYVGWSMGALVAILCILAWFLSDYFLGVLRWDSIAPYWNTAVMLGVFLAFAFTVSALKSSVDYEKQITRTDALTEAANTRGFYELAARELEIARRYKHPFTVIYMDIDDLKRVNDHFGHQTGDAVLRVVADTITRNLRSVDAVARLGGDEFAVLLPETGYEQADVAIRRLRDRLTGAMSRNDWAVTFSLGAVTFADPPPTVDDMVQHADNLMYSVKDDGKNAVKHERFGNPAPAA